MDENLRCASEATDLIHNLAEMCNEFIENLAQSGSEQTYSQFTGIAI